MTKQEWEKKVKGEFGEYPSMKFHQENGIVKLVEVAEWDKIIDFMHSLHLQELEKIRETIRDKKGFKHIQWEGIDEDQERMKRKQYNQQFTEIYDQAIDDVLLAITDES